MNFRWSDAHSTSPSLQLFKKHSNAKIWLFTSCLNANNSSKTTRTVHIALSFIIISSQVKKSHFSLFVLAPATPTLQPSTPQPLVNYPFSCLWSHNGWLRLEQHRGFLFFSPLLKLWLFKERKLQKALINGSRDAPALSHSALHNRQTYEAEPGMEYWRDEWESTQIRDLTSPLSTLSPCSSLCIFVEEGLPQESHSLSITEDQRGTEKSHVKKCFYIIWDYFSMEVCLTTHKDDVKNRFTRVWSVKTTGYMCKISFI